MSQAAILAKIYKLASRFDTEEWQGIVEETVAATVRQHTASEWGNVYVDAMTYHALHFLVLEERAQTTNPAASGPVTSLRTMDESIGFQQTPGVGTASADGIYNDTTWGRRYIALRDSRPAAHAFVV